MQRVRRRVHRPRSARSLVLHWSLTTVCSRRLMALPKLYAPTYAGAHNARAGRGNITPRAAQYMEDAVITRRVEQLAARCSEPAAARLLPAVIEKCAPSRRPMNSTRALRTTCSRLSLRLLNTSATWPCDSVAAEPTYLYCTVCNVVGSTFTCLHIANRMRAREQNTHRRHFASLCGAVGVALGVGSESLHVSAGPRSAARVTRDSSTTCSQSDVPVRNMDDAPSSLCSLKVVTVGRGVGPAHSCRGSQKLNVVDNSMVSSCW